MPVFTAPSARSVGSQPGLWLFSLAPTRPAWERVATRQRHETHSRVSKRTAQGLHRVCAIQVLWVERTKAGQHHSATKISIKTCQVLQTWQVLGRRCGGSWRV